MNVLNPIKIAKISDPIDRLFAFIHERHQITLKRQQGLPPPWTDNPILQVWRFCNVYRELDKVTIWIRENWRAPHADDPDLWFAMAVARFINLPETLAEIGYPVPWKPTHFLEVMRSRKARGEQLYTGAYMTRADPRSPHADKAEYQERKVFSPLWSNRESLRPRPGDTLKSFSQRLATCHGMGEGFMTGQVIADLKYVEPLRSASDWRTFAVPGPGSQRGLSRVLGRPTDARWNPAEWRWELEKLRQWLNPLLTAAGMPEICAQDSQNLLCEFDKYERVRLGEGKPRARFRPAAHLTSTHRIQMASASS